MIDPLDDTIEALVGAILDAAHRAPAALRSIEADLPLEFGLRRGAEGLVVVARPPEEIQSRVLCSLPGRFAFTLAVGGEDG